MPTPFLLPRTQGPGTSTMSAALHLYHYPRIVFFFSAIVHVTMQRHATSYSGESCVHVHVDYTYS